MSSLLPSVLTALASITLIIRGHWHCLKEGKVNCFCKVSAGVGPLANRIRTLTSKFAGCFNWQIKLVNLEGMSVDDKLYVEGKLLAFGDDDRAARFFKHNEPDEHTVMRLSALLPEAGKSSMKLTAASSQLEICSFNHFHCYGALLQKPLQCTV